MLRTSKRRRSPANDRVGAERGREAARKVARESLETYRGAKPKPFSIKPAEPLFEPPAEKD